MTIQQTLTAFHIRYGFPYSQDAIKQLKEVHGAIGDEPFLIVMDMEQRLQEAREGEVSNEC